MSRSLNFRRCMAGMLACVLMTAAIFPASALFRKKKDDTVTKPVLPGQAVSFSPEDFSPSDRVNELTAITFDSLPDPGVGILLLGEQPVSPGAVADKTALPTLQFHVSPTPTEAASTISFTPSYTTGTGDRRTIKLVVEVSNQTPIARNMTLSTYKNVAVTGWFDAVDSEGEPLSFQITSTPARGAVTPAEDGSGQFVYTPYNNKTGKDSFTYVAVDPSGNTSPEAKVSITIEKADTKVTYADMDGDPAHKAAIRLAEDGIYVGAYWGGEYYFQPDQPLTRGEFLSLAMEVAGLEPLDGVTVTGFYDDEVIPTWCKSYISSALMAGAVQGSKNDAGQPVFDATSPITMGEAAVMLNSLLNVADVPVETFGAAAKEHWAAQAAANLTSAGILPVGQATTQAMLTSMTRGEAAVLLDGALEVMDKRH